MTDESQGEGWWLASDGKWYPPTARPNYHQPPPLSSEDEVVDGLFSTPPKVVPLNSSLSGWTAGLMWVIGAAAVVYAVLAFNYSSALSDFLDGRASLNTAVEAENNFNGFGPFFALLWITGFVFQVMWIAQAHTTTTSLLIRRDLRKYSRGWAIGVWFIPIANLFSTPRVFAEHQRIADAPRINGWVDQQWKTVKVRPMLIWWWVLMLIGFVVNRAGASMIEDPSADLDGYQIGLAVLSIGLLILGAGVVCGARFIRQVSQNLRPPTP